MSDTLDVVSAFSATLAMVSQNVARTHFVKSNTHLDVESSHLKSLQKLSANFKTLQQQLSPELGNDNVTHNLLMQSALNFTISGHEIEALDPNLLKQLNAVESEERFNNFAHHAQQIWLYSDLLDLVILFQIKQDSKLINVINEIHDHLLFHTQEITQNINIENNSNGFFSLYQSIQSAFINVLKSDLYQQLKLIGSQGGSGGPSNDFNPVIETKKVESKTEIQEPVFINSENLHIPDVDIGGDDLDVNPYVDEAIGSDADDDIPDSFMEDPIEENVQTADVFYLGVNNALQAIEEGISFTRSLVNLGNNNELK